jgi:hypothetical protein
MKRGIAVLMALILVLSGMPFGAVAGAAQTPSDDGSTRLALSDSEPLQHSTGTPETSSYATGRPVDDVRVETDGNRVSLLVTDDKPEGTPLILDRQWLQEKLGKPVEFMRFHREGEMVDSYKLTEDHIIVDIPHFSTQNVTVTTVDGQFEVTGSASGQETQRVINYDVNETGIAILEIEGSGTREGVQRVDQFYSEVDNSTFEWEAGEIPRNVTLEFTGQGEKLGPRYNKSISGVSDGETVFFDLAAKDYNPNVTIVGVGQENGTRVTRGPYTDRDGDTWTLSFDNSQNNASIEFTGNTTGSIQLTNSTVTEDFDLLNATASENVTVENGQLVLDGGSSGWFEATYTTVDPVIDGKLNWTESRPTGTQVHYFLRSGSESDVNVTGSENQWEDLGGNQNVTVRIELEGDLTSPPVYSDGFEDGDLSEYTTTGSIEVTTSSTYEGSWSVSGSQDYSAGSAIDTDVYFGPGQSASGYVLTDAGWSGGGLIFGYNPNTGNVRFVSLSPGGSLKAGDNSLDANPIYSDSIGSASANIQGGKWYKITIEWKENGDQYFYLKDPSTGDVLATLSTSTSPPGDGGFGVSVYHGNSGVDNIYRSGSTSLASPEVDQFFLEHTQENNSIEKTQDPSITIDGSTASYTGVLNDSETATVDFDSSIGAGSHTAEVSTTENTVVDWQYKGNNEARAHVKNITLNGKNYTVDQYLADGETTTIPIDNTQTLQGENVLTAELYSDSETTHVSRIDARGHYEGRTILDNYTVNGEQSNLDETLADGETTSVNISSDAIYGTNNITAELTENSVQDNYDAEVVWYPENRTYFENVTVNSQDFGSPTFLGTNETLLLNVTDEISPGGNDHVFRMQSEKTTTDSLDFTEKVEFYKNVSVNIEEAHATYNKTTTETFDYTASPGVQFNFSLSDRVMGHRKTVVTYDGQSGVQNTTTFSGNNATVELDEEIPEGTEVNIRVEFLTYRVKNATTSLRSENALSAPYRVEIGVGNVTGNVTFETVEPALTSSEYEVILTENGEPTEEPKIYGVENNLTIPESNFDSASGFIVQRPRYSNVTYTGTVNTIYPTTQVDPDRNIVHGPALYSEPDETYSPVEQYTVEGLTEPLSVEWKQVGPYHLQWVTNESRTYNQTIVNVTSEGVSVFANGDRYRDFKRESDDDLVIHVNGSTTWDVYQYDYPQIQSDTDVSVDRGQSKTVEVVVDNPNDFTLRNVELVLEHGWIRDVEPSVQDIPSGESATFEVTVKVPDGTVSTTYTMPMNVTSTETGEVDTENLEVSVGGGVTTAAGVPLTRFGLIAGGIVFLGALSLLYFARSGQLARLRRELEKI